MEFRDGSGISWTICKQSAPRYRHITMSASQQHSIFTGRMLFLTPSQRCQSTEGESTEGVEMFSVNINGGYVQCIEHCCEYCPVARVVTVPL